MTPAETQVLKWGCRCKECPFSKDGKPNKPVLGEVPLHNQGVLVGEGPGYEEVSTGRPFSGSTGMQLDESLAAAGLNRGKLVVLNATCCLPPPNAKNDEKAFRKAVDCCRPSFVAQRHSSWRKPHFVMGKWAWYALAGRVPKGGLSEGRGFLRKTARDVPYIATWHPTFAFFYNPFEWGAFEIDLARFKRMLNGTLRAGPSKLLTRVTARDVHALVREGLPIAVDIETAPEHPDRRWTGKDPTRARLRTIGLGNTRWGLSFVWKKAPRSLRELVQKVIRTNLTVWHNGAWFDHRVLRRYGFEIGKWEDTRDARRALSSTSRLALGYNASLYDDCEPWKEDDEQDEKGLVFTDDYEKLCRYNAQDAVETARVWEGITAEAEWSTPRLKALYDQQKRLAVVAAGQHTSGLPVDVEARQELADSLKAEYAERKKKYLKLVNIKGFQANPNDLRSLLYKRHARPKPVWKLVGRKHGNWRLDLVRPAIFRFNLDDPQDPRAWSSDNTIKVDQGSLLLLIADPMTPEPLREIVRAWWQADAVRQARSTFIVSNLIDEAIGADGRLRAGINSAGAATGRHTCSEPNLYNLSEKKD
jgi:uracil-DNA glycosylase family 4